MALIIRQCNYCSKDYQAETRYLNRGQGIYCSKQCFYSNLSETRLANGIASRVPNMKCAYCQKEFYRNPAKKPPSGFTFCSRICKDTAQRIDSHLTNFQPSHYNKSISSYRTRALNAFGHACQNCGWDEVPGILEVNHKDLNRKNNELSNLEILCPTCHRVFHYLTGTGYYKGGPVPKEKRVPFYRQLFAD